MNDKITGKKLIAFVRENQGLTKAELAEKAGYMRINKNKVEVADLKGFEEALFEAHGTPILQSRPVRNSLYETAVHASGIILLGPNYLKECGVGPGDRFAIEVTPGEGVYLRLIERVEGSPRPIVKKPKEAKPADGGENTEGGETAEASGAVSASTGEPVAL